MEFSETLDSLKSNLPSQYRNNVIDYKTLKTGIDEVTEKLNKTGIFDLEKHIHLIMENGMKSNIDNHIREIFKKNKVVINENTVTEVFDDKNMFIPMEKNNNEVLEVYNTNELSPKLKKEVNNETSTETSVNEKYTHYNFKDDLEKELKESQAKLVNFINNANNKEEIIKGLTLKYYQIFYALKEVEKEDGKNQIRSSLIISINKVNPNDLDVRKLLDEIIGQNNEIFENEPKEITEEIKIDQIHFDMIRESLKDPNSEENKILENIIQSPISNTPDNGTRKNSNSIAIPSDIDIIRKSQSLTVVKFNENMLGNTQHQDSISFDSDDSEQENEYDDMYESEEDEEVSIILPVSSEEKPSKDKEIEPDPVALMGDSAENVKKRASIIQKRLSEYNIDDGITKEKFVSLFNNKKLASFRRSNSSNSCFEGKLSLSSSLENIPVYDQCNIYGTENNVVNRLCNKDYIEIPLYSYYTFSIIPEDQQSDDINKNESQKKLETKLENNNSTAASNSSPQEDEKNMSSYSRQSSYSSINTAKNSPEVKSCKVVNNDGPIRSVVEQPKTESHIAKFPFPDSQNSSTDTLNFYMEPQSIYKPKKRASLTNLFKRSKSCNHIKSMDNISIDESRSLKSNLSSFYKKRSSSCYDIDNNNSIYIRKTKSHSFSYHIKNPFKKFSKNSTHSLECVIENESFSPNYHLNESEHQCIMPQNNNEKRVEILLESDTSFLNKMMAIFKNLTIFEKDCKSLFETNINAIKKMLKEVSTPGKLDTYPWRNLSRLYRETDLWTYNGKTTTWQQATERLELFKTKSESITKKFKMEDSKLVFDQFIKLNHDTIVLKQFYSINQTALYMILSNHDKDTKLNACEGLPCFVSTDFFSDSINKCITYEITNDLLGIIPDPEKYSCPICQELAYKPIRLNCNHLFCLKCLIKAQKKNLDNCPVCRAKDAVKNATSKNLDKKLLNILTTDFPREIRARKRQLKEITHQQELEDEKEMASQPIKENEEEDLCTIM